MEEQLATESNFTGHDKAVAEALRMGLVLPEELTEFEREKFLLAEPVKRTLRKKSHIRP